MTTKRGGINQEFNDARGNKQSESDPICSYTTYAGDFEKSIKSKLVNSMKDGGWRHFRKRSITSWMISWIQGQSGKRDKVQRQVRGQSSDEAELEENLKNFGTLSTHSLQHGSQRSL